MTVQCIDECRHEHGAVQYHRLYAMLRDDVLLMQFGFRSLRQVLFGELSIPLHEQTAQQRRDALSVRRNQLELEAAARRARDDDAANFVDI